MVKRQRKTENAHQQRLYTIRREALRRLIDDNGGPGALASKLGHSNPSYLSQLAGPNPSRDVSEGTAREIEEKLSLPVGALDVERDAYGREVAPAGIPALSGGVGAAMLERQVVDSDLGLVMGRVYQSCMSAGVPPTPDKFVSLVKLAVESGRDQKDLPAYIDQLVKLAG